ncbi:hypothetical protein ACHWQZ_G007821 [Mnemiopsis leidyi]
MTTQKVRIKTDEQVRKKKRKRLETEESKNKKKKLKEMKDGLSDVKNQDKESEQKWSAVNIGDEKSLMAMGLASFEVLDEAEYLVQRSGKRKKTSAPKEGSVKPAKPTKSKSGNKPISESETIPENTECNRSPPKKLSFSEKKAKIKTKRKEKMHQVKLRRLENPDSEENKLRLEKLKTKRKAKKLKQQQDKKLKSEIDEFISEKKFNTDKSEEIPKITAVPPDIISPKTTPSDDPDSTLTQKADPVDISANSDAVKTTPDKVDLIDEIDTGLEESKTQNETTPVTLTQEEKENGKAWLNLDVCESIVKGLLDLGFKTPTPVQQACIPAGLLKYKDVIGAAETGSGKTLAFGIPLVQRVMRLTSDGTVKGLVLCPTRELALQVTDHLRAACRHTGVRIVPIVGGIAAPKQERLLSYKPPILVATPGRLWQLIQEHAYLQDLSTVKFIVIDEADRMVEDGHFEEVTQIIGRLPGPDQRNAFLFSATLAFTIDRLEEKAKKKKKTKKEKRAEKKGDAGIEMLVRNIGVKEKVEKVDFTRKRGTAETLTETYFLCNVEDKDLHLYYMLLTHPGKTLVFANSIDGVMNLVHIMRLLELPVFPLHSSLQQRQRFKYLEKFAKSSSSVLICTDVAARGLDIPDVDTVIHYQLPHTREAYIHRSGRTARADNPGLSVAIVGPKDFKSYKKIASQMSEFPTEGKRLRVLRPAVDLARQIFKVERLKTRPEQKEAKLVALAKEAGFGDDEPETESTHTVEAKKDVKIMKSQLKVLLQQPVIDPLNSSRYTTTNGAVEGFQTLNSFSLGISALEHSQSANRKTK